MNNDSSKRQLPAEKTLMLTGGFAGVETSMHLFNYIEFKYSTDIRGSLFAAALQVAGTITSGIGCSLVGKYIGKKIDKIIN